MALHMEELSESNFHRTVDFRCRIKLKYGEENTNIEDFLRNEALDSQKQGMVRTRLAFNLYGQLIGYYSLSCGISVVPRSKVGSQDWGIPVNQKYFPSVMLEYLGVDDRFQRKGYGTELWMHILNDCIQIKKLAGCVFIGVEALRNSVEFYDRLHFVTSETGLNADKMLFRLRNVK